jgi:hypothetical protein
MTNVVEYEPLQYLAEAKERFARAQENGRKFLEQWEQSWAAYQYLLFHSSHRNRS